MGIRLMRTILVGTGLIATSACSAIAQTRSASVPDAMACFHSAVAAKLSVSQCPKGITSVENIVYGWHKFDETTLDATAEALLDLINATDVSTRNRAVIMLGIMGAESEDRPGRPGTVQYLSRAYANAERADTRRTILDAMAMQSDSVAAAAFLGSVVTAPGKAGDKGFHLKEVAVEKLTNLGPAGRAELRRLDSQSAVEDPTTQALIRQQLE